MLQQISPGLKIFWVAVDRCPELLELVLLSFLGRRGVGIFFGTAMGRRASLRANRDSARLLGLFLAVPISHLFCFSGFLLQPNC